MSSDTAWVCIAAVAIVGIVALALVFKNQSADDAGVAYTYDDQNRLQAITPVSVKLKPAGERNG